MDAKDKRLLRNTILIFGVIVVLLLAVIVMNKVMTTNAIKEQKVYENWLKENCDCIKKERFKCVLEGFEYDGSRDFCVNRDTKSVTYPALACSEYNCSNEIKVWNNETEKWGDNVE